MSKNHPPLPARFHETISVSVHVDDNRAAVEWQGNEWTYHANAHRGEDGEITSYEATGSSSESRHLTFELRERVGLVLALLPARLLEQHPVGSGDRQWSEDFCVAGLLWGAQGEVDAGATDVDGVSCTVTSIARVQCP